MEQLSRSQFVERMLTRSRRAGHPVLCTFEITPACNLRCRFCYVALDPYRGPYLNTEQCKRVIDTVADAGVLLLTLTGGEVFTRRDFPEIYRHARARGLLVTIFTNATMVRPEHAELLRAEPPFGVEVSIYGADAEHYEGVTGIPGSFERFERGMDLLQSAGVDILVKHPVSTLTADHVDAIRGWCTARGLRHKFTTDIERQHDGGAAPELYRLESRKALDTRRGLDSLLRKPREGMPVAECAVADDDPDAGERLYQCGAGRSAMFVDALGNASHCVIDREPAFPILDMPWPELWSQMQAWVNQPLPADAPCSGCSLRSGCNNCPARARLATGSPYERDPHQCEITHVAHGVAVESRPLGACVA